MSTNSKTTPRDQFPILLLELIKIVWRKLYVNPGNWFRCWNTFFVGKVNYFYSNLYKASKWYHWHPFYKLRIGTHHFKFYWSTHVSCSSKNYPVFTHCRTLKMSISLIASPLIDLRFGSCVALMCIHLKC